VLEEVSSQREEGGNGKRRGNKKKRDVTVDKYGVSESEASIGEV
jgi:hypothetical protein